MSKEQKYSVYINRLMAKWNLDTVLFTLWRFISSSDDDFTEDSSRRNNDLLDTYQFANLRTNDLSIKNFPAL
jgi:hypothetical protein